MYILLSPARQLPSLSFILGEILLVQSACTSDCLGCAVLLCLVVCLTLLAPFFLPSHLTLKHAHVHIHAKTIQMQQRPVMKEVNMQYLITSTCTVHIHDAYIHADVQCKLLSLSEMFIQSCSTVTCTSHVSRWATIRLSPLS